MIAEQSVMLLAGATVHTISGYPVPLAPEDCRAVAAAGLQISLAKPTAAAAQETKYLLVDILLL